MTHTQATGVSTHGNTSQAGGSNTRKQSPKTELKSTSPQTHQPCHQECRYEIWAFPSLSHCGLVMPYGDTRHHGDHTRHSFHDIHSIIPLKHLQNNSLKNLAGITKYTLLHAIMQARNRVQTRGVLKDEPLFFQIVPLFLNQEALLAHYHVVALVWDQLFKKDPFFSGRWGLKGSETTISGLNTAGISGLILGLHPARETLLLSDHVSHWLGASLESALNIILLARIILSTLPPFFRSQWLKFFCFWNQ